MFVSLTTKGGGRGSEGFGGNTVRFEFSVTVNMTVNPTQYRCICKQILNVGTVVKRPLLRDLMASGGGDSPILIDGSALEGVISPMHCQYYVDRGGKCNFVKRRSVQIRNYIKSFGLLWYLKFCRRGLTA